MLVVKGYVQIFGVDYSKTFALVARLNTIRTFLVAQMNWKVHQLDCKTNIFQMVFHMKKFMMNNLKVLLRIQNRTRCIFSKRIYGLNQALRAWYNRIDEHLLSINFKKNQYETTFYVKHQTNDVLIVSLFVEVILLTRNDVRVIKEFKQEMMKVFKKIRNDKSF